METENGRKETKTRAAGEREGGMIVRISNPKWTIAIEFDDLKNEENTKCIKSAPIARWMVGLSYEYLREYANQCNWDFDWV